MTFRGPVESLYTAGVFRLTMTFSEQHPLVPPVVKFMHQVFHPNVSLDGQVVDSVILKDLWSPALTLTTIICHIRDMLGSTSVALHGSPGPCDGPAGEVKGGLTRVLGRKEGGGGEGGGGGTGGRKKEEEEKEKEEEMPVVQVWVVGAECAGLWLTDPHRQTGDLTAHSQVRQPLSVVGVRGRVRVGRRGADRLHMTSATRHTHVSIWLVYHM